VRRRLSTWLAILIGLLIVALAMLFALLQSTWLPFA
jgi:hypothetical protein